MGRCQELRNFLDGVVIGCNKYSCKMSALLNIPQSALWLQQSESQSGRSCNITEVGAFLKGPALQTSRLHVAFRLDQEQLHRASWVSMMEQLYPCLASKCELQRCKAHRHWNPEKARRVHASPSRSPMEESGSAVIRRLILV